MTQTIEQLTARVRELEEFKANVVKECANIIKHAHKDIAKQLAASQAYAEQLRVALRKYGLHTLSCDYVENHRGGRFEGSDGICDCGFEQALSNTFSTSVLDAYVAEKVKEATAGHVEDIRLKNKEIEELRRIKMSRFSNEDCWIYQGDGEDHLESLSCPVVVYPHVLMDLTRQRDLAVEALEDVKGCFDAAEFEGCSGRIHEANVEYGSLADLVMRRLYPALSTVEHALSAIKEINTI